MILMVMNCFRPAFLASRCHLLMEVLLTGRFNVHNFPSSTQPKAATTVRATEVHIHSLEGSFRVLNKPVSLGKSAEP